VTFVNDGTFYDIHMHALNLSHPYLLAFVERLKIHRYLLLNAVLGPIASWLVGKNLDKIKNLLAVMENDIGSFFLMMEDYLQRDDGTPLLRDGKLHIGGNVYSKIVLTPLMMDFGYKDIKDNPNTYYNELSRKPIIEQVLDVFNGIRKYRDARPDGLFEIYPFLGLNPRNYDMDRLRKMLDKYFADYTGSREELRENMGQFDGNIDHLGSNSFAGIKVYPPLGFDPWPDDNDELAKVWHLYQYCCEKGIPVTAHGSEGGFVAVPKKEVKRLTSMRKWKRVLEQPDLSRLKLNLAHFPLREKLLWVFPKTGRLRETVRLVQEHENVYVDFSNRAVNRGYYLALRKRIDSSSGDLRAKLRSRILFGTDFSVNLMSVSSYNEYLGLFSGDDSFSSAEKDEFCSVNPERFLFGGAE